MIQRNPNNIQHYMITSQKTSMKALLFPMIVALILLCVSNMLIAQASEYVKVPESNDFPKKDTIIIPSPHHAFTYNITYQHPEVRSVRKFDQVSLPISLRLNESLPTPFNTSLKKTLSPEQKEVFDFLMKFIRNKNTPKIQSLYFPPTTYIKKKYERIDSHKNQ